MSAWGDSLSSTSWTCHCSCKSSKTCAGSPIIDIWDIQNVIMTASAYLGWELALHILDLPPQHEGLQDLVQPVHHHHPLLGLQPVVRPCAAVLAVPKPLAEDLLVVKHLHTCLASSVISMSDASAQPCSSHEGLDALATCCARAGKIAAEAWSAARAEWLHCWLYWCALASCKTSNMGMRCWQGRRQPWPCSNYSRQEPCMPHLTHSMLSALQHICRLEPGSRLS